MKNEKSFAGIVYIIVFFSLMFTLACKKIAVIENTSKDVNITGYLDNHPEEFSEFRKILQITKTNGFLQAYGSYTLFLPTNDAVAQYLKDVNAASVTDLSEEKLHDLVLLHIVEDSIKTTDFVDGKLRNATMLGQYLVTGITNIAGTSKITVDRQANLMTGNISVGNGIIHVIDHVLKPATKTVAQTLEANPKFSIFTRALKETGLYDKLNILPKDNPNVADKYYTVFAETDAALTAEGYDTYEKLALRYSKGGNPKSVDDSLYLYVAYHITRQANYFVDYINPVKLATLAVVPIGTSQNDEGNVVINELVFNEKLEKGAPIKREESDISASNGVVHTVTQHFYIKKRFPTAVYWDVADQPEFRKQAAWRKGTYTHDVSLPPMQFIKYEKNKVIYNGNFNNVYWRDVLQTPLVAEDAPAANRASRALWMDLTTPYIVAGRYKLWVCYPKSGRACPMIFYLNGKKLNRTVDLFVASGTASMTDEQREQLGWKRYMGPINSNIDASMGRLLGTVTIPDNGSQTIRIQVINGTFHDTMYLDMFHFIPEKEEQLWPRFWTTGRVQKKGEPD